MYAIFKRFSLPVRWEVARLFDPTPQEIVQQALWDRDEYFDAGKPIVHMATRRDYLPLPTIDFVSISCCPLGVALIMDTPSAPIRGTVNKTCRPAPHEIAESLLGSLILDIRNRDIYKTIQAEAWTFIRRLERYQIADSYVACGVARPKGKTKQ